jgi:hypothetical protein
LIIDHARSRNALKRGGQFHITSSTPEIDQAANGRELEGIGEAWMNWPRASLRLPRLST